MTRVCTKCKIERPMLDYPKNKRSLEGRIRECKFCAYKRSKIWRDKEAAINPKFLEDRKFAQEKYRAKRYGLSLEQIREAERASKGLCAI